MDDNNIIDFQINIPEEMAFTYPTGRKTKNNKFLRATTDGRIAFLDPIVEDALIGMDVKPGERVAICKREKRSGNRRFGVEWEVERVDPPGAPATQPPPASRTASGVSPAKERTPQAVPSAQCLAKPNGTATENHTAPATPERAKIHHTHLSQALSGALISTVDAFLQTSEYAKSKGLTVEWHLDFTGELLQRLATSAFIAIMDGKAQALALRARNEELRESKAVNGGTAPWPQ